MDLCPQDGVSSVALERENNIAELKNHHSLAELKIFGPDGAGNPNPEDAGPTQYTCT